MPPTGCRAPSCAAPIPISPSRAPWRCSRRDDVRPPGVNRLADVAATAVIAADASIAAFVSIADGATVGARTTIYPHVTIGAGARIGEDCVIHARASIRERVQLGNRVIVQDGAVIGSDGFGFAHREDGTHQKIPQIGDVVIEDDVEIGANAAIDRPAVGETRVGAGSKIDNLVQVAHGVKIGRDVLLAAQVGVAGSTVIEDRVTLAGQVGVAGHLLIGKGRRGHRAVRHPELGRGRCLHFRLPGDRQPRVAQGVRRVSTAARAQESWSPSCAGVSTRSIVASAPDGGSTRRHVIIDPSCLFMLVGDA